MNCKPNDMAVLVRDTTGNNCVSANIGATVEVTFARQVGQHTIWALKRAVCCHRCGGALHQLLDADLQPIRPTAPPTTTSVSEGLREAITEQV